MCNCIVCYLSAGHEYAARLAFALHLAPDVPLPGFENDIMATHSTGFKNGYYQLFINKAIQVTTKATDEFWVTPQINFPYNTSSTSVPYNQSVDEDENGTLIAVPK